MSRGIDLDSGGGGSDTDDQTAAEVAVTPFGSIAATDVQAALEEIVAEASTYTDEQAQDAVGGMVQSSTTVTAVYTDATPTLIFHVTPGSLGTGALSFDVATQAELDAHTGDTTDAHDASAISFVAGGTIAGTDVQTAVAEVATDAASALSTHEGAADPHAGYVLESLFNAQTVIQATSDNTPVALTVAEETVVGRITGGNIDDINPSSVRQLLNTQTGSTYTAVIGDAGKIVEMTTATVNVVIIPTNASVAFPTGTRIDITQYGTGQTRLGTNSTAVTIFSARNKYTLATTKAFATIYKRDTNEWVLGGDLG